MTPEAEAATVVARDLLAITFGLWLAGILVRWALRRWVMRSAGPMVLSAWIILPHVPWLLCAIVHFVIVVGYRLSLSLGDGLLVILLLWFIRVVAMTDLMLRGEPQPALPGPLAGPAPTPPDAPPSDASE